KDLFYGFIRSIYGSKEYRNTAKISGISFDDKLPKMTTKELSKFQSKFDNEKSANVFDNPNLYLMGLYGIDLAATIDANKATSDNSKFILKFKTGKLSPTSLTFLEDNSAVAPFSNHLIADKDNKNTLNATNLRVSDYGNPYSGTGPIKTDGILTLAPYVVTKYSSTPGESRIISKNIFYADKSFVNDSKNFVTYETINESPNIDAAASQRSRKASFLNAENSGEYLLNTKVTKSSSVMSGLLKYKVISSINETGTSHAMFMRWNEYGYINNKYNAMGRKFLWGESDVNKINSSPKALSEFYTGTGALVRESIGAAINWMAMIKAVNPGTSKVFYPAVPLPADYVTSGLPQSDAYPKYMDSLQTLKNIYESHHDDKEKAWKSTKFQSAKLTLETLAKKYGATASNPAQIPIFRYQFKKDNLQSSETEANKMILKILNELTSKVKFVNETLYEDYAAFRQAAWIGKTNPTLLGGFGPDYSGLGTSLSQYLKPGATGGVVGLFAYVFKK
ncbi:MAG: hypothetical protein KAG14_05150, partial [Mycoplasmataceae bacterium]|nr:hypothetical protein [Mycoplasmataceae bacterium]